MILYYVYLLHFFGNRHILYVAYKPDQICSLHLTICLLTAFTLAFNIETFLMTPIVSNVPMSQEVISWIKYLLMEINKEVSWGHKIFA